MRPAAAVLVLPSAVGQAGQRTSPSLLPARSEHCSRGPNLSGRPLSDPLAESDLASAGIDISRRHDLSQKFFLDQLCCALPDGKYRVRLVSIITPMGRLPAMAEEVKTMGELQRQAKAAVLQAIIEAAPDANNRGVQAVESIARAFAAVAEVHPRKGDLSE